MRIKIFIHIVLSILATNAFTQNGSAFTLIKKIKGNFTAFEVDYIDNLYLLTGTDQLKKLNEKGDSLAVFNNIRNFGKVSTIDVSNPLRVLLYYKDFSTVIVLDRLLNMRSKIDLRQQNIFQVQAISLSYDNKIWLYDEQEHKLKKIDEDGKLLFETSDFRQLFNQAYSFSSIIDQDGLLYLYDEQNGVLIFDYYGTLKKKISFSQVTNFKVSGKYLYGIRNDSLIRYQPDIFFANQFLLPQNLRSALSISFTANYAYALKEDGLEIYLIN